MPISENNNLETLVIANPIPTAVIIKLLNQNNLINLNVKCLDAIDSDLTPVLKQNNTIQSLVLDNVTLLNPVNIYEATMHISIVVISTN
jgi:hypothetical protein